MSCCLFCGAFCPACCVYCACYLGIDRPEVRKREWEAREGRGPRRQIPPYSASFLLASQRLGTVGGMLQKPYAHVGGGGTHPAVPVHPFPVPPDMFDVLMGDT